MLFLFYIFRVMEEPYVYVSEMIDQVFGEYRDKHEDLLKKYESAIRNYTGTKYASMNRLLRSKPGYLLSTYKHYKSIPDTVAALKKTEELNKNLLAFFKELPPFIPSCHLIVYRSVKNNIVEQLDKKGTHTDTAFTSVSTNLFNTMTMNVFNDDKNTFIPLRIHLLPGIEYNLFPINKISLVPEEEEILFAPPIKYYLCKHYVDYRLRINEEGESIRDCILIPDEPRYKKLLKDQKWLDKWSSIIAQEETYMFKDINTANIGAIYPSTNTENYKGVFIFKFIQQIEYLIDMYISRIHHYNDENAFQDINVDIQKIYSKVVNSIYDARIKGEVEAQLSHYLEALNASIVKTAVPKSKFSAYGEWMKAVAVTKKRHGGAGTRNIVVPDDPYYELNNILTHIVKDASINAMLDGWIKKIRDFLLHYGIPIDKVFELQPWFYDINICGYKPIRGAEDLDASKIETQREKVTLIYRFAMKFSGLLWHHVINGDNITQLPVFMNKEVLNARMKHILEKHGKIPSHSGFVGNKQMLKEVYDGDRKLHRIYREFTIPNAVPTEEMYKKDRVSQTHAHYIQRGHLIEPLSASEESILQKTNSLFKRGITAIRLRNVPTGDKLPWITGSALYKVKRDSPFAKMAHTYRKAVLTGPSGSTQLMLEFAKMFNMDERKVVLSLIPWMYIHQDHSIFEILLVANNYIGGYELTNDDQDYIKSLEGAKPHYGGATQRSRPVSATPAAHRISYNVALKNVLRELKPIIDNAPPGNKLTKEVRDTLRNTQELLNSIEHPIITSENPMAIEAFMAYKFPDMDGVDYARLFGMQTPF